MKNKICKILMVAIALVIISVLVMVILNKHSNDYQSLNKLDQRLINEYDRYVKKEQKNPIWMDYKLSDKSVLVFPQKWKNPYLINPENKPNSIFSVKIDMPDNMDLEVYKISLISPQLYQFYTKIRGNFNEINKEYYVYKNPVYFVKNQVEPGFDAEYSTKHFITFLTHESFHYYMQKEWKGGSRFSYEELTQTDIELLKEYYKVLSNIQQERLSGYKDRKLLLKYAREYLELSERRFAEHSSYINSEQKMETAEGTATYIGIRASEYVDYPFGIMSFSNVADVPFNEIMKMYEAGEFDDSYFKDTAPYETGTELCFFVEALGIENWQQQLNEQTLENPITLYTILKEYISAQK